MKLSQHAFTRFWNVHAWTGVCGGLVLYVMFFAGTITLFHAELEVWEEPLAQASAAAPAQAAFEFARARLRSAPDALWFFPGNGRTPRIAYEDPQTQKWHSYWIDLRSGSLVAERERLAHFLYELHFLSHPALGPALYYVAGVLAVGFLLALASGVLIHLKDIVRQFHQFRPLASFRVFWSDMHKVVGVMGLPFQIMYAYTGALIVLAPLLLRALTGAMYGADSERAERAASIGAPELPRAAGPVASALAIDALIARARSAEPRLIPEWLRLVHFGHANGVVDVGGSIEGTPRFFANVRLRAQDGAVLHLDSPGHSAAIGGVQNWATALHFARFGGYGLRFVYLVLGIGSCLTILTGNLVWLHRRARHGSRAGYALARLTAGVGAGTWVATASLFAVSRILPFAWGGRTRLEELCFVLVLAACIGWAFAVRTPLVAWWQQLSLAGCCCLAVPLLAANVSSAGVFGAGPHLPSAIGVELGLSIAGLSLWAIAARLRRVALRAASAAPPEPDGTPMLARSGGNDA